MPNDNLMRMIRIGNGCSTNVMINVEVMMHNEFVNVVPTFLCCIEPIVYNVACMMLLFLSR